MEKHYIYRESAHAKPDYRHAVEEVVKCIKADYYSAYQRRKNSPFVGMRTVRGSVAIILSPEEFNKSVRVLPGPKYDKIIFSARAFEVQGTDPRFREIPTKRSFTFNSDQRTVWGFIANQNIPTREKGAGMVPGGSYSALDYKHFEGDVFRAYSKTIPSSNVKGTLNCGNIYDMGGLIDCRWGSPGIGSTHVGRKHYKIRQGVGRVLRGLEALIKLSEHKVSADKETIDELFSEIISRVQVAKNKLSDQESKVRDIESNAR
tara:strand:- start:871 stop:1653 length:783 start_codon:yes stop_codon:yes gene_type:complete